MNKEHGDQLMARVLNGENHSAANQLLTEFLRGYPVEKLRLLLHAEDESACRAGAWIASELGNKIKPLLGELSTYLDHPSKYVRFFVLDAILNGAGGDDGESVARAVLSIRDPEEAVRWKCLRFLSRASHGQLTSALPYIQGTPEADLSVWLLRCSSSQDTDAIIDGLNDADRMKLMFAAAASARLSAHDRAALERAATSSDAEVRSFAQEELALMQSPEEEV